MVAEPTALHQSGASLRFFAARSRAARHPAATVGWRDEEAGDCSAGLAVNRNERRLSPKPLPPRLALRVPDEAADALGVSPDFFDEHVRQELRLVRRGRLVFVAVAELERWLDVNASRTLEGAS